MLPAKPLRVLFLVEGSTDIRFVVGFGQICDLTDDRGQHGRSGTASLAERMAESRTESGDRSAREAGSFNSSRCASSGGRSGGCDLILSQEVLRGSLNANIIGLLRRKPVVTYMGISPLEYFRCRRERRQIGPVTWWLGSTLIRTLATINGRLATRCLAMGPYLREVASALVRAERDRAVLWRGRRSVSSG